MPSYDESLFSDKPAPPPAGKMDPKLFSDTPAPSGGRGAFAEEGVLPENPLETGVNLVKAAGAYIKSGGLQGDKARFGAAPTDSVGGVRGAVGGAIEGVGEFADDMLPKTPGQVVGMEVAGAAGEKIGGKIFNKLIAQNPEARAATDKAIATAKSMGFKLMPSQETQNYLAGLFETVMQKLPGGQEIFKRFQTAQQAAYTASKNDLVRGLTEAGAENETNFGGKMADAIKKSNDIVQARADALLQKGLLSKEAYQAALDRHEARLAKVASDSLKESRQGAAASIGGFPTAEGRGIAVQVERAHQAALDHLHQEALWDRALVGVRDASGNVVQPAMPPEVNQSVGSNIQKTSQQVLEDLEGAGITEGAYRAAKKNLEGVADPEAEELLSAAEEFGYDRGTPSSDGPKTYTLQDLQRKKNFYGALADGQRNPDGSFNPMGNMYRKLQKAVESDMDAMMSQPGVPVETKRAYQMAKAFSKEKFGLADLAVVKGLWNQNPSAILNSVVKAGDKRGTQILIQALGGGEVGRTQVRRHIFDEVFGAGDQALPTQAQVMKKLSEYSDNISAVFTKDEQKQLYELAEKSKTPAFVQDQYNKRVKSILDSYRMRANAARDPILQKLANKGTPQELVRSLYDGNPATVIALKKYLPAAEFSTYQKYGMRDLLADPELPQKGAQAIKDKLAAKPEFYKNLLGEKGYADMSRIGDAELLLPGYKDLKSPSKEAAGTTTMGMAATFGVMGLVLHPFGNRAASTIAGVALGLTIAPQTLSELYLSDSGRRIVTTLLRLPENDPRSLSIIGKLAAAGFVTQQNATGGAPAQTRP